MNTIFFLVESKAVYAEILAADMEVVHIDARGTVHEFYRPIVNRLISQDQ
jgi:hypothetical protein